MVLSTGLQVALWEFARVPEEQCTDSLSAAGGGCSLLLQSWGNVCRWHRGDLHSPQELTRLMRFDLLILDDLRYMRRNQTESSDLFGIDIRAISTQEPAYHRRYTVLALWQVLVEPVMTLAAMSRWIHHSTLWMSAENCRRRSVQEWRARQGRNARSTR